MVFSKKGGQLAVGCKATSRGAFDFHASFWLVDSHSIIQHSARYEGRGITFRYWWYSVGARESIAKNIARIPAGSQIKKGLPCAPWDFRRHLSKIVHWRSILRFQQHAYITLVVVSRKSYWRPALRASTKKSSSLGVYWNRWSHSIMFILLQISWQTD